MNTTNIDHAYLQNNRQIIELTATVDQNRSWAELVQKFPIHLHSSCPLWLSDIEHCYARKDGVEQAQFVLVRGSQDCNDPDKFAEMSGLKTTNVRELVSCAEQHANLPELLGYDQHTSWKQTVLFSTEWADCNKFALVTWLEFDLDRVYSYTNSVSNKSPGNWHLFRK